MIAIKRGIVSRACGEYLTSEGQRLRVPEEEAGLCYGLVALGLAPLGFPSLRGRCSAVGPYHLKLEKTPFSTHLESSVRKRS